MRFTGDLYNEDGSLLIPAVRGVYGIQENLITPSCWKGKMRRRGAVFPTGDFLLKLGDGGMFAVRIRIGGYGSVCFLGTGRPPGSFPF